MSQAFLRLLPFLWAGMILPTWTSRVIMLLGTDRPLTNSYSYIAGNAAYRFVLGWGLLFVFSTSAVRSFLDSIPPIPAEAWLALGAGLVALAAWAMWHQAPPPGEDPAWLRAYERLSPLLVFAVGALAVASPGVQYVYFLGGIGAITSAGLENYEEIILLLIYVALLQTMLLIPVMLYHRYRDRADELFDAMKNWLARRGGMLLGLVLLTFGLACLYEGWRAAA